MADITNQGIQGVSLEEYLSLIQQAHLNIDPNWNLDPDSPDGQQTGIYAEMFANLDEALVEAYNSKDPDKASGEALTSIGKIHGIPRQDATFSVAPLSVTGTPGSRFPAGSLVRNSVTKELWVVMTTVVVGSNNKGSGFVQSQVAGPVNAAAGELIEIVNPSSGITSITNIAAATVGRLAESDTDFRVRRFDSVGLDSNNQIDSLYAMLANVRGVSDLKVYENDTNATDVNGIPARNLAIVVNGGTDMDVAQAIYAKKTPGPGLYGGNNATVVSVTSPTTNNTKNITFQRAIGLAIYIQIKIKQIGSLPEDLRAELGEAIEEDAQKTLLNGQVSLGFNQGGYDIGEVVPVGRLYTPVNKVLGQYGDSYVTEILIGTSPGSLAASPIQPAYNQLAVFDRDNVTVVLS